MRKRRRKAVKKKPTKKLFVGDIPLSSFGSRHSHSGQKAKYLSELFGIEFDVSMHDDQALIKKRAKGIAAYLQKYLDK